MKPGERIALLKKLAKRCGRDAWSDIDLTFRQFSIPWEGSWTGSRASYALRNLENAKDEDLLELEEYLFPSASKEIEPFPSSLPWEEGCFRLFLSHVSKKKKLVGDVKEHLAVYGIDGFVAHKDISPTKKWLEVIEAALHSCDAVAAFLTPGFSESVWTDQELGFALARRQLVIPIDLGVKPYGFVARYQALPVPHVEPQTIAADIFDVLIEHDETHRLMAVALVNRLATSTSFQISIDTMKLIKAKIKVFAPEMVKTMQDAVASNYQVGGAFTVPKKIEEIAAAYETKETVF